MKRQSRFEALRNAGSILGRALLVILVIALFADFQSGKSNSGGTTSQQVKSQNSGEVGSVKKMSNPAAESGSVQQLIIVKDYKELNYKDIVRQKKGMKGKHIFIDGKVLQVSNSWGNVILRVASFNNNDEVFYVTFSEDKLDFNLLEDDYVIIKGTLDGLKTYTAVLGNQITLPEVLADSIELQ